MTSTPKEKSEHSLFSDAGKVAVRRGQIRRIRRVIKTLVALVRQFLLGYTCPVRRGIVVQEREHFDEITGAFLLQNILQLHQQRYVILTNVKLVLWKIVNEEVAVLIPKTQGDKIPSEFLHSKLSEAG